MATAVVKKKSGKLNMVVMEDRDNNRILYAEYGQFPSGSNIVRGSYWRYRPYTTVDGRMTVHIYNRTESPIAKWSRHFNAKRHA